MKEMIIDYRYGRILVEVIICVHEAVAPGAKHIVAGWG